MRRALVLLALAFPASAHAAPPPKVLQRLDGTLSAPAGGAPKDVALRYVRANLGRLGLDRDDLQTLQAPTTTTAGAITTVRWRQAVDGIAAADSELRVNLARDGRVLNVVGEPAHDLRANTAPAITAGEAVRAVQTATGSYRALPRRSGGARSATYADGTAAELALDGRRLVWRVTYEAGDAVYDAFVDARSGLVRRKVDLVKTDTPATVWENHPGAPQGGTAALRDLETNGWLTPAASVLDGPNAHVYSDVDDNDAAELSEEVAKPFALGVNTGFAPAGGGCTVAKPCTWDHNSANSWTTNRRQSAVQAFYFANRFHDHLAAAPIGFGPGSGSFDQGVDPVRVETHNGAGRGLFNNASMYTPPDGSSPRMELRLFRPDGYRTMNAADDGSIVYHEYAHGLSNRLVTDAGGRGALNSPQAGAMGEGWSDFYAKDFIVGQFPGMDSGAPGEIDMGAYTDTVPHTIRAQALDCPVLASAAVCPSAGSAGSGGFTYGDFGRIAGAPEVHADGEIWAQTLWDLRAAVGIAAARRLVTDGMRLSPPEPTFLDMRNAILLADQAAGSVNRTQIWEVFARRGMGYFATSEPLQDFSTPPGPGAPRGTITGVVTDRATGRAIAGASASIGSLADGPDRLAATSGGDGAYSIGGVPSRTYSNVLVSAPGYDRAVLEVTVPTGSAVRVDIALDRNWAALAGGARALPGPGSDEYADQGCGPEAAIDQLQSTAWSTVASAGGKSMVVALPQAVDMTELALDPGEGCGDDSDAATRHFRVETSTGGSGGPWTLATEGAFTLAHRHALTRFEAKVAGVRAVRLTLLSNQLGGDFFDFSELVVHGAPAQPVVPPTPTPTPTPPPAPPAAPRAPSFTLPASGKRTVRFKVRCAVACRVTARLTVDRPTARRLGLGRRLTVVSLNRRAKAGTTTYSLRLPSKARKLRSFRARLKVTVTYAGAKAITRSRQLTVRR